MTLMPNRIVLSFVLSLALLGWGCTSKSSSTAGGDHLAPAGMFTPVAVEVQNKIYIDPDASDGGDGSQESPFNSWYDLPDRDYNDRIMLQSNTGYYMKAGTYEDVGDGKPIQIQGNDDTVRTNVVVSTYDGTERAHIKGNDVGGGAIIHVIRASNVLVENIHIEVGSDGGSAFRINGNIADTSNIQGHNLELDHGSFTAVDGTYTEGGPKWSGLTLMNSYLHDITGDGMFIQRIQDVKILNNIVVRANAEWYEGCPQNECGGDGIQLHACDDVRLAYNFVDRSDSANKFCIIHNRGEESEGEPTTLVEHNTCIGPKMSDQGGAGMMLGHNQDTIIRYNTITMPPGEYGHGALHLAASDGIDIYGNIIARRVGALSPPGTNSRVFNNVFYDIGAADNGNVLMVAEGAIEVRNNIFDNRNVTLYTYLKGDIKSNNLFWIESGSGEEGDVVGDPMFTDPENGDFSLLPDSPAIDAGVMTGLPHEVAEDMMGTALPQGSAPDMGAIESE